MRCRRGSAGSLFLAASFLACFAFTGSAQNQTMPPPPLGWKGQIRPPFSPAAANPYGRSQALAPNGVPRAQLSDTTPNFGGFYAAPFIEGSDTDPGQVQLVTGDFNGDGSPDLARINSFGDVTVRLNDGKGGFGAPVDSQLPNDISSGESIRSAQSADLNGDGISDLIAVRSGSSEVLLVALGNKDGTFQTPTSLALPNLGTVLVPFAIAVGSLTSANHVDLAAVIANGDHQLLLQSFLNDGAGHFTAVAPQTIASPAQEDNERVSVTAVIADPRHTGKPALLLRRLAIKTTSAQFVDLLAGRGDGTFEAPVPLATFPSATYGAVNVASLVVTSLRHDPDNPDLVVNNGASIYVALNNGDGTFAAPTQVFEHQGIGITQLLVADLDSDGYADLIAVTDGSLSTLKGKGDGSFGNVVSAAVAHGDPSPYETAFTVAGDFDGDGKVDFVNSDWYGDLEVAFGRGDGSFAATPVLYLSNTPVQPAPILASAVADLNGDGITDLLTQAPIDVYTALADGKGGFVYKLALPQSAYNTRYIEPVTGDFDGDGRQDAILVGWDGTAAVALSKGDGTLKTPVAVIKPAPALSCALGYAAVGDIDGDGKQDIVFTYGGDANCSSDTTTPSGYFVVKGKGNGTFSAPVFHAQGSDLFLAGLAKFHGKNQPLDLVLGDWRYPDPKVPAVTLLAGNGDGSFGAPVTIADNYQIAQILTDDFNQDGKPDLTVVAENSLVKGGALLYAGHGDGTFTSPSVLGAGLLDEAAVYTDVNGDGIPDLVGAVNQRKLQVYLGTGKGSFASPQEYLFPSNQTLLFAGNFLGDNTQSIVSATGIFSGTAFFMNQGGTKFTVKPSATTVPVGATVDLAATLVATLDGRPAPTGTITFYDGTTQLGSVAVGSSLNAVALATGTHQITAKYSGDADFNPNAAAAVTVTVQPGTPDFTLDSSASTLTVSKGQSGTLTLKVAGNGNIMGSVAFQCSGLPSEATCSFSPASLSVTGTAAQSATLTIGTKAASSSARAAWGSGGGLLGGGAALAVLFVGFCPRRRRGWLLMLLAVISFAGVLGISGCGGGSASNPPPSNPGTPTGSSTVTVTATATQGSTTVTHTTAITLTVQ
jgi:hypothetical protein